MRKKILVGCLAAVGLVIILVILGGFFVYQRFIAPIVSSRLRMPSDLETPSVLVGSRFISKSLFLEDPRLGTITDIVKGELDPSPGLEIGIVGSQGALFVDETSGVKSSMMFSAQADHVDVIDVDGDSIYEYLNRGSWAIDASLIDHKGNSIWTYGGGPGVDDMCAGDIDGDGELEFVVGFNGGGGVHLLDKNGKKRWKQPDGNVWHVELVDTNGDGSLEIVHSNAGGEITVRNRQGGIISRSDPAAYFSDFSLCKWPSKEDRQYALLSEDDTIWLFDFDGKAVAQFDAPKCGTLGHARGVPIKIKSDQPEYLAVIVEFSNWKRSILYVYNPTGALVYQEVLPEVCGSIAAISLDNSGTDTMLIGGEGKVWQYKVQNATNSR